MGFGSAQEQADETRRIQAMRIDPDQPVMAGAEPGNRQVDPGALNTVRVGEQMNMRRPARDVGDNCSAVVSATTVDHNDCGCRIVGHELR